jgi:hypothetical protein
MTYRIDRKSFICSGTPSLLLALTVAGILTSCATAPEPMAGSSAYKFWVLRYKPPVDAAAWVPDAALAADPEGAALNIADAMQRGNIDLWLANWQSAERPSLSSADSDVLLQQWQSLRGRHFSILGRVVAEANVIVELSYADAQGGRSKLQIPLKRSDDRWWLTALDSSSEYFRWESSPNKIIDYVDPDAFQKHLNAIQGPKPKAKADAAPRNSVPVAGL